MWLLLCSSIPWLDSFARRKQVKRKQVKKQKKQKKQKKKSKKKKKNTTVTTSYNYAIEITIHPETALADPLHGRSRRTVFKLSEE